MPSAGSTFLIENPLPGQAGGGRHLSVVLSDQDYNLRTGQPIVAPLRRVEANAYRTEVAPRDFTSRGPGRPLDGPRVLDLGQLCAVPLASLGEVYGEVSDSAIDQALQALPRQFQLGQPPWRKRGEIWSSARGGVVLVSNDAALNNRQQQQYLVLPHAAAVHEAPLLMIGVHELGQRQGQLSEEQQRQLDALILQAFGIEFAAE